ncbi:MAG: hypothetical protein Q8807_04095, partial ['Waltheria sp.' little leaf phytoplasma]|nr:hypothetical protein ['Waltheria sp.' little leaf phytoplasma]
MPIITIDYVIKFYLFTVKFSINRLKQGIVVRFTKEENDAEGKPTRTETPEHLVQDAGAKEEESKEQSKESAIHQAMATTHKAEEMEKETSQKSADVLDDAKGKETEKELDDAKGKETEKEKANAPAKKCMVKGLNEDRKLVVNMGAAVLIIMGLGV